MKLYMQECVFEEAIQSLGKPGKAEYKRRSPLLPNA